MLSFTLPHVTANQFEFLYSVEHRRRNVELCVLFFLSIQLKSMDSKVVSDPINFHCTGKNKNKNILQNILCSHRKKESYTSLEQHEIKTPSLQALMVNQPIVFLGRYLVNVTQLISNTLQKSLQQFNFHGNSNFSYRWISLYDCGLCCVSNLPFQIKTSKHRNVT